ncbi:MAG: hypothetical protein KKB25_00650 [Nanoarchaeota archaeon]|nr:hypothetical protein [Nanoarchaeota archaeon]
MKLKKKGMIQGVVIAAAAIGLLITLLITAVLLKFYSDSEKKLSDRVYFGLSTINYFYLTEKNINEFAQIVTEITAKELGEACGGFPCYSWTAGNPSYSDLRDKFESELRGKITGFPAHIGNGGRMSFAPPRISGLEMDESSVKISLFPQQVYRKTDSFFVNASSNEQTIIDKNIRYLLLAKIGQKLYGNGTYVRDWNKVYVNSGKFDCNGDGVAEKTISVKTKLSGASLNGCKIFDIDFDVDVLDASGNSKWNSYGTNCYGIANSSDSGINAGKIEGGKIYVQIDSLLEKSLICGIDGTDGLASITDIYGETSKHAEGYWPSCSIDETKNNAWQNSGVDGKISSILNALKNQISGSYSGISIVYAPVLNLISGETVPKTPTAGSESGCSCIFYDCGAGSCVSTTYCSVSCNNNLPSSCSSSRSSGWCSSANSCSYSGDTNEGSISRSDSNQCSGGSSRRTSTSKSWYSSGYFLETKEYRGCGSYCYTPDYYCTLGAYFKFTFTPDITFKIIDTAGDKIVEKGTTDFEDLYFAVKFKPDEPYVIGDTGGSTPPEYTCEKTSGQTCESGSSCPGGKTPGSGTCESGKVCCKPQESEIIITGEGKDITI